ncbi:MAG: glycine--tRNA ligase [Chitinispirillaceae bacterium]|nr:glycine--tRNA ligase [Chitinispirillaceae bacterium]
MSAASPDLMSTIVSLCKRRGFIFQSSEIYGGLNSCWDYGPLGVELKRNVKEAWWRSMVHGRRDIVGLDASILMHPNVWKASGHLSGFTDPLVDCRQCKARFRADHLQDLKKCPECGGQLTEARRFNLMFKTFMGPVEDDSAIVYMRPETAQGIFVNFLNVQQAARLKPPFGIAQTGKSFRNEITPGNFTYRTREFEQMEMEFFVPPAEDSRWYEYWKKERFDWYVSYGIKTENLRLRDHAKEELAHYAKACCDVEYNFPFGWSELEGIANRTDFDLKQHSEHSGRSLAFFDEETKQHYFPYVIEPAAGADRAALAFLVDSYAVEGEGKDARTVLRLHPSLAPVKVAVLPLVKRDGMPEKAEKIYADLLKNSLRSFYDHASSIGRRYARQDEAGTPFCVTVDSQTLKDDTVTIRERDSRAQYRVASAGVVAAVADKLKEALL